MLCNYTTKLLLLSEIHISSYISWYIFAIQIKIERIPSTALNIEEARYLPIELGAEAFIIDLIASSSVPHVGEGISLSHIINISLQASTARLWSLLMLAIS